MNTPVDSDSAVLQRSWTAVNVLVRGHSRTAWVVGAALFPLELALGRILDEGPSTEIVVCESAARPPAEHGPSSFRVVPDRPSAAQRPLRARARPGGCVGRHRMVVLVDEGPDPAVRGLYATVRSGTGHFRCSVLVPATCGRVAYVLAILIGSRLRKAGHPSTPARPRPPHGLAGCRWRGSCSGARL